MYKAFDEQKIDEITEYGIAEFAVNGPDRANINRIAKDAGVSIGVLYKYFGSKEGFFAACLEKSVRILGDTIGSAVEQSSTPEELARALFHALRCENGRLENYNRMYHLITTESGEKATELARRLETETARAYRDYLQTAKDKGLIESSLPAEKLAFFFDNLLMMLQFTFSCDYYRERYEIFCGEKSLEDMTLEDQFVKIFGAMMKG